MSILVRGIEMPKTEEESKLLILTPDGVTCLTKLGTGNQRFDTIEVQPHGRLIDADALSDYWKDTFYEMLANMLLQIAPTVIPADKDGETWQKV